MKIRKSFIGRLFSKAWSGSADHGNSLMAADHFNRMLYLERKRSHRTGNPFVLLVINIAGLAEQSGWKIPGLCEALQGELRDTDLCGWRQPSSAIGIIFTALQNLDERAIESAISAKMTRALSTVLDPEEFERLEMSFHFFPEKSAGSDAGAGFKSDEKLYPDVVNTGMSGYLHRGMKRGIDIAGSLCFIIIFSPVFALIALAIKLSSEGPVFFQQRRIGRFGEEFSCLKFRTMYSNCDDAIHKQYVEKLITQANEPQKVYKIVNDPRVTSVGRLLRKTSLDEIPQFLNVLSGDMSLVGPRPPIPYEIACYRPWHRRRIMESKPGITGLWQVYGRSRTNFDDMVRLDIRYIEEQSIWLDLKLLFRTPWAVITGLGAY